MLPSHNCIIIDSMFSFQGALWISSFQETQWSSNFLKLQSIPWWRVPGSNRWPPACKAGALPAELTPHLGILDCLGTFFAVPSKLNNVKYFQHFVLTLGRYKIKLRLSWSLLRKEVIQPHLPIRLPCYDFTPITGPTFGRALLAVRLRTSGVPDSHGVTGGVYKARERIHRGMLIRDY